jgi:hypothetical protein
MVRNIAGALVAVGHPLAGPGEAGEVVLADQRRAGRLHGGHIERRPDMPTGGAPQGRGDRAVPDRVGVVPPERGEAGVEARAHRAHPHGRHVRRQQRVEAAGEGGRREACRHHQAGDLAAGVYARIRPSGQRDALPLTREPMHRVLDHSLHRALPRLELRAGEARPVVLHGHVGPPVA